MAGRLPPGALRLVYQQIGGRRVKPLRQDGLDCLLGGHHMGLRRSQQGGIQLGPVGCLGNGLAQAVCTGHIDQSICFTWNNRLIAGMGLQGQPFGPVRLAQHMGGQPEGLPHGRSLGQLSLGSPSPQGDQRFLL